MEVISYISTTDGFTHYILNNALWVPFELWILLIWSCICFIYLVLKKIIW